MASFRNSLWVITSFLVGAALVTAFSPINLSPLAFLLPAMLIYLLFHASPKQAAIRGWAFGIGFFAVGISWVFISIHRFGGTNSILAALITLAFILLLAAPHAAQGYLLQRYFPKNTVYKVLVLFPASWILIEWIREWLFTGFPWLYLASSQTNGFFKGYLPIVGSFGTSGIMMIVAGLIYLCCFNQSKTKRFISVLVLTVIILGGIGLANIQWTKPIGQPIPVSMIQGNIPQSLKWDPKNLQLSLSRYWRLTKEQPDGRIIVWPENSIPLPAPYAGDYLAKIDDYAAHHQLSLAMGIPIPTGDDFFNSMLTFGQDHAVYHKRHLVPFGEYVPFENILRGLIDFFDLPMSEFVSGADNQPLLKLQNVMAAPFICYEIAYSSLVRQDLPKAELFIVISDDAWFGDSLAPWQHLQIAQMEAISSGRDLLSATNNGVTALVSFQGIILKKAPQDQVYVLQGEVQPRSGLTPWAWFGNMPIIFLAIFFILFGCIIAARKK